MLAYGAAPGDKLPGMVKKPNPDFEYTVRFRRVANKYPAIVTNAYNGDTEAAMKDDDDTVAERVREWEISQGREPRDWVAIGRNEGRETTRRKKTP